MPVGHEVFVSHQARLKHRCPPKKAAGRPFGNRSPGANPIYFCSRIHAAASGLIGKEAAQLPNVFTVSSMPSPEMKPEPQTIGLAPGIREELCSYAAIVVNVVLFSYIKEQTFDSLYHTI